MLIVLPSYSDEEDNNSEVTEKTSISKARRKRELEIIAKITDPDLESHGDDEMVRAISINQVEDGSTTSSITVGDEIDASLVFDTDVPLTHLDQEDEEDNGSVSTTSIKSINAAHIKALFTKDMSKEDKQKTAKAHMNHMIRKLILRQSKVVEKAIEDSSAGKELKDIEHMDINEKYQHGIDVRKLRPIAKTADQLHTKQSTNSPQTTSILKKPSYI